MLDNGDDVNLQQLLLHLICFPANFSALEEISDHRLIDSLLCENARLIRWWQ